jgi:hypothetical protein
LPVRFGLIVHRWFRPQRRSSAPATGPRYPEDDQANDVQRLLVSCDLSARVSGDYATLMLVARLGPRSIQVARLQVDDVR